MTGIELIAAERLRQVESEEWDAEHDDRHEAGELAVAAACYALPPDNRSFLPGFRAPKDDWEDDYVPPDDEDDDGGLDDLEDFCVECGDPFHLDDTGGYNPPCVCGAHCRACHEHVEGRYSDEAYPENVDDDDTP